MCFSYVQYDEKFGTRNPNFVQCSYSRAVVLPKRVRGCCSIVEVSVLSLLRSTPTCLPIAKRHDEHEVMDGQPRPRSGNTHRC